MKKSPLFALFSIFFFLTLVSAIPYNVTDVINGATIEHRFYYNQQHFMTIIDASGTLAIRPHPGVDVNGWGSTLYLRLFSQAPF